MKISPLLFVSFATLVAMTFSGCESPTQGAGTGAIAGAIIGGIAGGNIRSAAIGAGAGAVAGAVAGKIAQDDRRSGYVEGGHYRMATMTDHYGFVRSPYRPFALVDVRGIPHGERVVDPVSERIFINP